VLRSWSALNGASSVSLTNFFCHSLLLFGAFRHLVFKHKNGVADPDVLWHEHQSHNEIVTSLLLVADSRSVRQCKLVANRGIGTHCCMRYARLQPTCSFQFVHGLPCQDVEYPPRAQQQRCVSGISAPRRSAAIVVDVRHCRFEETRTRRRQCYWPW